MAARYKFFGNFCSLQAQQNSCKLFRLRKKWRMPCINFKGLVNPSAFYHFLLQLVGYRVIKRCVDINFFHFSKFAVRQAQRRANGRIWLFGKQ